MPTTIISIATDSFSFFELKGYGYFHMVTTIGSFGVNINLKFQFKNQQNKTFDLPKKKLWLLVFESCRNGFGADRRKENKQQNYLRINEKQQICQQGFFLTLKRNEPKIWLLICCFLIVIIAFATFSIGINSNQIYWQTIFLFSYYRNSCRGVQFCEVSG